VNLSIFLYNKSVNRVSAHVNRFVILLLDLVQLRVLMERGRRLILFRYNGNVPRDVIGLGIGLLFEAQTEISFAIDINDLS
jgi:hypothetical protein